MHKPLTEVSGFSFCVIRGLMLVYRELGTRTARPRRRRGNQSPSRALVSARFLTRRNVYQERCRPTHSSRVFLFWWTVQDENRDKQRQGITIMGVSCLLIFLTRRGILGSVQQIEICQGSINPLSQSLTALPALPKGELFAADGKHL